MRVIGRLKRWWYEFQTETTTQQKVNINPQNVDERDEIINKLDHDRQMKQGKLDDMERKEEAMEQNQDKDDVSRYLQKKQKRLSRQNLDNATDLKKMLDIAEEEEVEILSRTRQESFGHLKTHVVDGKGIIYLINDEGDIVMAGPTYGRIFTNPGAVHKEIQHGFITVNLNNDGMYAQGPETVEVPRMIATQEQGIIVTENHTEKYMDYIAELNQEISQLRSQHAAKEKAMVSMAKTLEEQDRIIQTSETLGEATKKQLETRQQEMESILHSFDDMQRQFKRLSMENDTWEDVAKDSLEWKEHVRNELMQQFDQEEIDVAENNLRKAMDLLLDRVDDIQQMKDMASRTQPQQPAPPQTPEPDGDGDQG